MKTLEELAQEVYEELGEPTDISEAYLVDWFRSNIGLLNTLLDLCYEIDVGTQQVSPLFYEDDSAIYAQVYYVKYFNKKFLSSSQAAAQDSWVEISSADRKIRRFSKNDISKGFLEAKRMANDELNNLVSLYKINRARPRQVIGEAGVNCDWPYHVPPRWHLDP